LPVEDHGVCSEWRWVPASMSLTRYDAGALVPFWSALAAGERRVGLLDVPFAPFLDVTDGFEVSEWGPHDVLEGRARVAPLSVASLVQSEIDGHPYAVATVDAGGPDDHEGLRAVAEASLQGIGLRGDLAVRLLSEVDPHLAVVVFTEIHHASHLLWHTIEPGDADVPGDGAPDGPTVRQLYEAVDREVERLVEVAGEDASVVVFALHGMRATRGIPTLLPELLRAAGLAHAPTWRSQSWKERLVSAFGAVKRHSPPWARALYQRSAGHSLRVSLARSTMLDALDWPRTRVFSLPTDQHGWLRVNLVGRERDGTVALDDYAAVCEGLETALGALTAADGRPLVSDVLRTATGADEAAGNRLPDLVVHWADAAHDVGSPSLAALKLTGQHKSGGFCVAAGPVVGGLGDDVDAHALHAALLAALAENP
ncbi:MAG: hypothetical protein QOJ69_2324, partial [Actinomycetota bacterium]|nr:hypothetical protein [Actinomycetota bacterium]